MNHDKAKQASRFLNPPPEQLGRIIEIVNLIPPDYELPDLGEDIWKPVMEATPYFKAGRKDLDSANSGKDLERARRIFNEKIQERLKDIPVAFLEYLNVVIRTKYTDVDFENIDYHPTERYGKVKKWRENLRTIAQHAKRLHELKSQASPESLKGDWSWHLPLQAPSACLIDNDFKLQTWSDGFIEAIKGVDAWRIRECARCNRIFWAGRSDMWSCSTACAHALRSKRWRDNYQTKYKLQRNGQQPLSSEEVKRLEEKQTKELRRTTISGAKKGK